MAIAMVCKYTDVLRSGTLKNIYVNGKKMGYQFDIRLSYYRGHFLSLINELSIYVDGERVPDVDIKFCLNGKEFGISELHDQVSEFWPIIKPATIKVFKIGGLEKGEHEIDFRMEFRSPYMPISDTEYMPWDSGEKKILTMED
ncbi:MAG: hypothetical protein HDR24_07645 [Lachnospiraceae bacterium]|nr:hypothetical protein [Lachnospiraceae bacterium]